MASPQEAKEKAQKGAAQPAAAAKPGEQSQPATEGAVPEAEVGVPADLLKQASATPSGVVLESFDPMEKIPTLAVGESWTPNMTVAGYFEETQVIASHKFIHSKTRNAEGVPTQLRHILRVGSPTGARIGIWTTGELKNTFEKMAPGTFVSILYKGLGVNAKNLKQHFFEYKRQAAQ